MEFIMDEKDKHEAVTPEGKRTIVTIRLTAEDAERLETAFAEGKLKELGVLALTRVEERTMGKQWGKSEHARRSESAPGDDTPPLP
jgi:hypothetical protein